MRADQRVSEAESKWLREVFSGEGMGASPKVRDAVEHFFAIVVGSCHQDEQPIMSKYPELLRSSKLIDGGAACFEALALAAAEQKQLSEEAANASGKSGQKAGQFTFGSQDDFVKGVLAQNPEFPFAG